jgi:hypothetical protein
MNHLIFALNNQCWFHKAMEIKSGSFDPQTNLFWGSPVSEVIKKLSKLKLRSQVFDWSETVSECSMANENC